MCTYRASGGKKGGRHEQTTECKQDPQFTSLAAPGRRRDASITVPRSCNSLQTESEAVAGKWGCSIARARRDAEMERRRPEGLPIFPSSTLSKSSISSIGLGLGPWAMGHGYGPGCSLLLCTYLCMLGRLAQVTHTPRQDHYVSFE